MLVGLPLLALALTLLAAPNGSPDRRRLAYLLIAGDAVLLALAVCAFYAEDISRLRQAQRLAAFTRRLPTPQVMAGVSFPAGSEV